MRTITLALGTAALALALPAAAQNAEAAPAASPGEIVAAAPASEWIAIAPDDLLVMTLAADAEGEPREVVMQVMPPPFSQGWVENIRTLARAHWYDGIAVTRVQDNYVVQWGDPNAEEPTETKSLPSGLNVVPDKCYQTSFENDDCAFATSEELVRADAAAADAEANAWAAAGAIMDIAGDSAPGADMINTRTAAADEGWHERDSYAPWVEFYEGWPLAATQHGKEWSFWPVHCYGMVGVGRGMSPDTGSGAELYTVIGHAPRHLDRNIALVGRVVEGIEHLSSLPRGTGPLGFYEDPAQNVPIVSIRVASDLPESERPRFEYLSTEGETFARYLDARANRRDPFFIVPAGGVDICNAPVPVRRVSEGSQGQSSFVIRP